MALRWGFVSTGKITNDFVNALGTLSDNDHELVAVAAQDKNRAEEFAKKFSIPTAYGNYLDLAKDSNVEIVYIGNLNPQHYEVSRLMLENGKHVLCEKPMCMNEKQAKKLISYAERKNLFLMEAIWSRCFPSYQYLKKQIDNGILGEIKSVEAEFGISNAHVERVAKKALGGGTVLDLGVYVIQLAQWVFQQAPKSITATGTLNEDGVDTEVEITINYGGNQNGVAKLKASSLKKLKNTAIITGTKGQIKVPNFWSATTLFDVDGTKKEWPLPETQHETNFKNSSGLRYEADVARKAIRSGKIQSENVPHNDSLIIAQIEDEIRKQIGVKFPEDD